MGPYGHLYKLGAVLVAIFGATLATIIRAGPRRVADKSLSG
jgi:hypothetical protein